jgi:hypothetical protein
MGFASSAVKSLQYNRSQQNKGRQFFRKKTQSIHGDVDASGGKMKVKVPSIELSPRARKRAQKRLKENLRREVIIFLVILFLIFLFFKVLIF